MNANWESRWRGAPIFALVACLAACQSAEPQQPEAPKKAVAKAPVKRYPTAVFALGDFWKAEAVFGKIPGVVFTDVGYTAGTTTGPSYDNIGDHVQALRVAYDPKRVTYKQLLNAFWNSHDAVVASTRREYQCIIFYADEQQRGLAEASLDEAALALKEGRMGRGSFVLKVSDSTPLRTRAQAAEEFYPAERFHQKYRLQEHPYLYQALRDLQPQGVDLLATTIAVRFNSYMGGQMLSTDLRRYAKTLARSEEENKRYQEIINALTRRR